MRDAQREREEILNGLEPMFEQAVREGMKFQSTYDPSFMLTPEQLREYHSEGKFIWGKVNWRLVPDLEKIKNTSGDGI